MQIIPLTDSKVVGRLIYLRNASGDAVGAARLFVDFWRVLHDLRRGQSTAGGQGVPLLVAEVELAARALVFRYAEEQPLDFSSLTSTERQALARELELLETTNPPFEHVVADRDALLQVWMRQTQAPGWIPPGGVHVGEERAIDAIAPPPGIEPSDVPYLGWATTLQTGASLIAACPPSSNLVDCHRAMLEIARRAAAAKQAALEDLRGAMPDAQKKSKLIFTGLAAMSAEAFPRHAPRFWTERLALRAVRLALWVAEHRDTSGDCLPPAVVLATANEAVVDPANDKPLSLTRGPDGAFTIRASALITDAGLEEYTSRSFRFACTQKQHTHATR